MKKVFILDTNVLLMAPESIFKFEDNDVVIPISVIEEVDRFKSDMSENGRNARQVSRVIDRLRERGALSDGVKIDPERENSGSIFIYLGHNKDILPELLADNTDNHILAIGLTLKKQFGDGRKVIIVTKDTNLRIKSDAFGIVAEDFEADKVDISSLYLGTRHVAITLDIINDFYANREVSLPPNGKELNPNEFVILHDKEDENQFVYGMYDAEDKVVRMIDPLTEGVWGIFPRNLEQTFAMEALLNENINLVTLTGGAGTGKTLLAIAAGLAKTTDEDIYQKLLVARPVFPLGKDLGFLPGDLNEKLNPWMQPIFDNLELIMGGGPASRHKRFSKSYQELIDQGILSVEPLTYIRGRSLPNQFFIVDEAQNLTPHEIKTILTRAGEGTKIILTGDPYQIDNPYIDSENNGLTYVIERFRKETCAAHVSLKSGERSKLASLAANLL